MNKPTQMNILHVYATYYPDRTSGVAECIRQLGLGLREAGAESRIFALSPRPIDRPELCEEGQVVRAKSWGKLASCDIGGLGAWRKYEQLSAWADITHHHAPWPFGDLLHILSRVQKPLVVTWHSDVVRQRLLGFAVAPLRETMLRRARTVIATSPNYAKTSPVLSRTDVSSKVRVIAPGIQDQNMRSNDDASRSMGSAPQTPFFLFLGALRYYKGLPLAIQAARACGASLIIAGEGGDRELRELAGGADNIVFAGRVSEEEKWRLLRACTALVLPSHLRSEAFGMVLVEAAMCGKPMISCEIGTGTSFINVDGMTGLVVPPRSPEALATAMKKLIGNQSLCETMGRSARSRYEQLFGGRATAKSHLELYESILKDARSSPAASLRQ
jgi:glycosyltransferase involved in cell wall biosynthesis